MGILFACVCVSVCVSVCMYVWCLYMYVCMYVCMYVLYVVHKPECAHVGRDRSQHQQLLPRTFHFINLKF